MTVKVSFYSLIYMTFIQTLRVQQQSGNSHYMNIFLSRIIILTDNVLVHK